MLKLKLQYFGHLMWRADSLEKTLMLGKSEVKRRRGWQRTRWWESITNAMDVSLNKLRETVKGRGAWHAAVHGDAKSQTLLSNWTTRAYHPRPIPGAGNAWWVFSRFIPTASFSPGVAHAHDWVASYAVTVPHLPYLPLDEHWRVAGFWETRKWGYEHFSTHLLGKFPTHFCWVSSLWVFLTVSERKSQAGPGML